MYNINYIEGPPRWPPLRWPPSAFINLIDDEGVAIETPQRTQIDEN